MGQAIQESVEFVVIAGDLYDGDWRDFQTGLFFVGQMGRLAAHGIPVYLLYGNHDAANQITRSLALPDNVRVFSARDSETFTLDEIGVALHGQSYRQRDIVENLVPAYPQPVQGMFNIGVLHTGLGGMGGHADYAPCTHHDLVNKGYDYWALGHVHQRCVLNERPHVVFPGNLQGRHIREAGPKSAYLVTVDNGEVAELAPVHADVVRWVLLSVSVDGCTHLHDVVDRVRTAIGDAVDHDSDGRLLACRVELIGRGEIHITLLASGDHLLAEVRAAALGFGDDAAWIERVVLSTQPAVDLETHREREDALGELLRMLDVAAEDEVLHERFRTDIGKLVSMLPAEVGAESDDAVLDAAIKGDYAALVRATSDYLMARLTTGDQ